jgi:hypothetical protein
MRHFLSRLWNDDCGALLAVEWVFIATILVIGSVTGLVAVRDAIVHELEDFAEALMRLSHCYHVHGFRHSDFDDGCFADDDGDFHYRHHQAALDDDDEDLAPGSLRSRPTVAGSLGNAGDSFE